MLPLGLAHIFNRLYQASGRAVFHVAARRWLDRLLDDSSSAAAGFLEGAAGIGLVLLAAAKPLEPRWDLSFRYSPLGPLVVDSISVQIVPGQKVAIVVARAPANRHWPICS